MADIQYIKIVSDNASGALATNSRVQLNPQYRKSKMLTRTITKSAIVFVWLPIISQCANILGVFPMPGGSHYILAYKLMKGLAEAGHNITFVSPFKAKSLPENGTLHEIVLDDLSQEFQGHLQNLFNEDNGNILDNLVHLVTFLLPNTNKTLHHPKIRKLVESRPNFDAVIMEQFSNDGLKIFAHIFNCPLIVLNSVGPNGRISSLLGNYIPVSYIRHMYFQGDSADMNVIERVYNLGVHILEYIVINWYSIAKHNELVQSAFPNSPNLASIYKNISLAFLNSHSSFYNPQPLTPNMIEIGGYHIDPPKKLPQDLQTFLDEAKEGVIYFSMGSNLKSKDISEDKKKIFLNVLGGLKQKIIWKFEEHLPEKPDNMIISKWLSQQDILAHPNVKLFIGHGGLLSITETIYHGVPILVIPVFGDQPQNAKRAVDAGYGLAINYRDKNFTEAHFKSLVDELLNNPKYRKNARRISRRFHDKPMKPLDTAVYWIEYVIRNNGAKHLQVAGVKQPWYQLFMVDVLLFIIVSISILIKSVEIIIKGIVHKIKYKRPKVKTQIPLLSEQWLFKNKMRAAVGIKVIIFVLLPIFSQCANILGVFPLPGGSHYILAYKLMKGLAEAGHNVTFVSPFKAKSLPEKGTLHEIVLDDLAKEFHEEVKTLNLFNDDQDSDLRKMLIMASFFLPNTNKTLHHPKVRKLVESKTKFDAVIMEHFSNHGLKVFSHIFECPLILLNSVGPNGRINSAVGNYIPASYVRHMFFQGDSEDMNFLERVRNVGFHIAEYIVANWISINNHNDAVQSAYPNSPDIATIYKNISLVLLNSHSSFYTPQPLVPNMVEVGGYHIDPPKKLPHDIQTFLDEATDGVIYFSMGSNLNSKDISLNKRKMFLKVLGGLKQKIIWKFEENLPNKPDNMIISKWLSQQDILAHPNVKLFISHGGLLSLTETIHYGVPILVIPVFGDQPANAKRAVAGGYGLAIPYNDKNFTEDSFKSLIHELLYNSKYIENSKKISRRYHDRPMRPIDTAVYWIEYVIRNKGAEYLRVAGRKQPWYQFFLIDVLLFVLVTIFIVSKLISITLRRIVSVWGRNPKIKTQ
ncbi:uncharacterized protein LOC143199463 [Rhynchophorus ferrugineus]|uniref:uncharacterized protein LOC143199463 n=1 Tax=Rhynchophorus ferrugineus TaxID=354439 RepID=UPI003FCD5E04